MTSVLSPRRVRLASYAVACVRIGFGLAFIAAPQLTSRRWLGSVADAPGGQVVVRSMGVRDGVLGVGLLLALRRGDTASASRWLGYGAAAGLVDVAATAAALDDLPRSSRAFLAFIVSGLVGDATLSTGSRTRRLPEAEYT
jgi:hypothetical protein